MKLRAMVVDDEAMARRRMQRLLEALDVDVVAVFDSADGVLEALESEPVDVLLLDIRMPGLTGLDLSALLPTDGPVVVFTTAYPQHAVDAFGLGAAGYLVKPIELSRLRTALERVSQRFQREPQLAGEPLGIPSPKGVRPVMPEQLVCALYEGQTLKVHTVSDGFFADCALSDLERRLPDPPFVRVHRRGLVNLNQVELFEPLESGGFRAHMKTGVAVEVSRQAARALRRRLKL